VTEWLLETVLGRSAADLALAEARLPEHAVYWAKGQSFPMIRAQSGSVAQGLLIKGLGAEDLARLDHYEAAFDYDLRDYAVELGTQQAKAQVFMPSSDRWEPGAPWALEDWIAQWGQISLYAAQEVMAYFGRMSGADVAQNFPAIRQRAASRISAEARPHDPQQDVTRDVMVHTAEHKALSWFGLRAADLQHRKFDGSMGPVINRGGLWQGEASVVLPYDPVRDTVLMVQQFRTPVFLIGDPAPWMWEAVAGMVDPGETPQDAAHREAREEADLVLDRLEYAGGAYSSSGSSTEYLHLFVGLTNLPETGTIAGRAAEDEDIRSQILSFDELMGLVDRHELKDLPSLSLANWLGRHRDRLRNSA
jgi:nudix-type nucleoside diphosphatase (YffH/AdpP family)